MTQHRDAEHPDIIDIRLPEKPRPIAEIITRVTSEGEVMVTMPSGRMRFMSFWEAVKFVVQATRRGFKVKVDQ